MHTAMPGSTHFMEAMQALWVRFKRLCLHITTFHGLEGVEISHLELLRKTVFLLASLLPPFPCCSKGSLKGSFFCLSHLQRETYCCGATPPAPTHLPHATASTPPDVLCPVWDSSVMPMPKPESSGMCYPKPPAVPQEQCPACAARLQEHAGRHAALAPAQTRAPRAAPARWLPPAPTAFFAAHILHSNAIFAAHVLHSNAFFAAHILHSNAWPVKRATLGFLPPPSLMPFPQISPAGTALLQSTCL